MRIIHPDAAAFPLPGSSLDAEGELIPVAQRVGLSKREYAVVHLFAAMCGNAQEPINAGNVQMWAKLAEIAVDCWIN